MCTQGGVLEKLVEDGGFVVKMRMPGGGRELENWGTHGPLAGFDITGKDSCGIYVLSRQSILRVMMNCLVTTGEI